MNANTPTEITHQREGETLAGIVLEVGVLQEQNETGERVLLLTCQLDDGSIEKIEWRTPAHA